MDGVQDKAMLMESASSAVCPRLTVMRHMVALIHLYLVSHVVMLHVMIHASITKHYFYLLQLKIMLDKSNRFVVYIVSGWQSNQPLTQRGKT